jgi:hypothetical protein
MRMSKHRGPVFTTTEFGGLVAAILTIVVVILIAAIRALWRAW